MVSYPKRMTSAFVSDCYSAPETSSQQSLVFIYESQAYINLRLHSLIYNIIVSCKKIIQNAGQEILGIYNGADLDVNLLLN